MKIAKIEICSFRGIPNNCELNFINRQGSPISSIIYGSNGSGKSSIVDAIEYCLQGRIERSTELKNKTRPSVLSYAFPQFVNSDIKVTFEDSSVFQRQITISIDEESGDIILHKSDSRCHPSFSISPIVLRRNDIISYNVTPEVQRQLLMLQFVYDVHIESKLVEDPEIKELDSKIIKLRREREEKTLKVAEITNIPIEELKLAQNNLEQYIRTIYSPIGQKIGVTKRGKIKKHIKADLFNKYITIAKECDELTKRYKNIRSKKRKLVSITTPAKFKILNNIFAQASIYLTSAFKQISNVNYIDSIELSVANITQTSLSIKIMLINGKSVAPNQIFSEANNDLMVLLLYLSLIRVGVDRGQEKILILDDVLQSVDASIRANFIVYILKELKDWQLFITCHDRLWLNQLRFLFNNASHSFKEFHITNWSFSNGPVIREANLSIADNTLKEAIATDNVRIMASISGLFLEKICQELSVSLNCSIERKPGDRYTIGDLWPSLKKNLRKTSLSSLIEIIDKSLCIRNLLGCHYNEWAEAFSDDEVKEFANSVQELYEKCYCNNCNNWIEKSRSKGISFECKCRKLQY